MKMLSRVGVRKYLTRYYFLRVQVFYNVCWVLFVVCLDLFLAKGGCNLHAAHKKTDSHAAHEALLMYFLLSCITQIITLVQCMKNSSQAVHES